MKYRKKPIVIDAVPYSPNSGLEDGYVVDGQYIHLDPASPPPSPLPSNYLPAIVTAEGAMIISPGDMVITGVKGERYPCKPDIFALSYDPAE